MSNVYVTFTSIRIYYSDICRIRKISYRSMMSNSSVFGKCLLKIDLLTCWLKLNNGTFSCLRVSRFEQWK